jgi:hypothetical protein
MHRHGQNLAIFCKNGDDNGKKNSHVLVVPLIAALTAQAAATSEHHHTRAKGRVVASQQWRNSNAYYGAPGYIAVPSRLSGEDEGAMTSGLAGH